MSGLTARVVRTRNAFVALLVLAAQMHAAAPQKTAAHDTKPRSVHPSAVPAPLTPRERVEQLLNRFTFGARPGEVEQVLGLGADQWLTQQLNPDSISDAVLQKRLAEYPALMMSPAQTITAFPERKQVFAILDGKAPYPTDPLTKSVYEVQVYKAQQERDQQQLEREQAQQASDRSHPRPELSDADKAARRKQEQESATRVVGDLFARPKSQRMNALIALPVEDRAVVSNPRNLGGDQRAQLLAEFTPREREAFRAMGSDINSIGQVAAELEQARLLRDILSERQLQAVMTNFWMNHFNVFLPKDADRWYTTSYERDVIRPHALGSFRDLLLATAQSPAMMVYLDNYLSIGPDSPANGVDPGKPTAKRGSHGLNENYGREVMELHTLGVDGGYTQADVTALAAILTGWGVDHPEQGGGFLFNPRRHEPGSKLWLGYRIADDGTVTPAAREAGLPPSLLDSDTAPPSTQLRLGNDNRKGEGKGNSSQLASQQQAGLQQGIAALNLLAASPHTAHFICYLLAQYFVADDPPPTLVNRLQGVYVASQGDIRAILRALIASPEFNSRLYFRTKVKTPEEFVASAFRTTGTDPQNAGVLANTLRAMGMPLYRALPPTGYYLTAHQWMNSGALVDRLNFAYQLTSGKLPNQRFDAPRLVALSMLVPGGGSSSTAQPPIVTGGRVAGAKPDVSRAALVGVASPSTPGEPPPTSLPEGANTAVKLLETTMIGGPASARTNQLIFDQMRRLPAGPDPIETLNTLAALVMGSPEFQVR